MLMRETKQVTHRETMMARKGMCIVGETYTSRQLVSIPAWLDETNVQMPASLKRGHPCRAQRTRVGESMWRLH